MIHVECPDCSKTYDVADELAGKAAKCRDCGGRIPIPQLRTDSDSTSERTKPTQPKPASSKSPSPKATTAPPAKSKPTVKPKPATKKREDDFVEEDYEDVAEFDDVEEVVDDDDDESDEQFSRMTTRSNRSRKKTNARRNKKSGPSVASKVLSFFTGSFVWWVFLAGILTCAGFAWSFYADPLGSRPLAQMVAWIGLPLLFASSIWMIVVTFRVSPGWGMTFIMAWLVNLGLNVAGHRAIAGGISLLVCAVSLILVVQHWKEFRAVFLCQFVLGMFLVTPLAAVKGVDRMMQDFEAEIPTASPAAGESPKPDALFNVASIPIPGFRDWKHHGVLRNGYHSYFAEVDRGELSGQTPGTLMQMHLYLPVGADDNSKLPCVLVTGAGTPLLHGSREPGLQSDAEFQPYTAAGFAVLGFSLDGIILNKDRATDANFALAYKQFQRSGAGTVNVRNAVEFLINKVPEVDPNRIYIAGHSSAATLALLAAEHEPRLKGCIAYAPATDVVARLKNVIDDSAASRALPGVADFAKQSSPLTHASKVGCPVFLFHAADDSNVPVADSRRFAELLKSNRKTVEYVEVPTGNHYDSMIQQGIPRAIVWLKQLAGTSDSLAATATAVAVPSNRPNSAVPKGAELPTVPFVNPQVPSNAGRQPSERVVTFRFQSFNGNGDSTAAARQALRNVSWADLNDLEVDAAKGEIRIGQLGGSVNSEPARQALIAAGFQLQGGVSIGNKSSTASAAEPSKINATKPPAATLEDVPEKSPPASTATAKPKTPGAPPAAKPVEEPKPSRAARRVAKFRYERYTGKGSSVNAVREALKRIAWADQEDIVLDAKNREIRIGLTAESPDFEPARKALQNAGFLLTPGVTTAITKD